MKSRGYVCLVPVSETTESVGAGLLAKTAYQSTSMLPDPPLSRASPLPQGFCLADWHLTVSDGRSSSPTADARTCRRSAAMGEWRLCR
ncbi:hypothetical protein B1219_23030 [Pseudomonas ogarae]|nr:hypothetical protein B1219_23030 [Pseudomonas ogarae]OPG80080.1 hypothetical protein B1218_07085 [Pseudomonas ogarae]